MYLSDITFIEDGSSDFLPLDSSVEETKTARQPVFSPLINFGKRRLVAKTTGEIQQYQNTPYLLHPEPDIESYLLRLPSFAAKPIALPGSDSSKLDIDKFNDAVYQQSVQDEPRNVTDKSELPEFDRQTFNDKSMAKLRREFLLSTHGKSMRTGSTVTRVSVSFVFCFCFLKKKKNYHSRALMLLLSSSFFGGTEFQYGEYEQWNDQSIG
jgi:hypothetical protein